MEAAWGQMRPWITRPWILRKPACQQRPSEAPIFRTGLQMAGYFSFQRTISHFFSWPIRRKMVLPLESSRRLLYNWSISSSQMFSPIFLRSMGLKSLQRPFLNIALNFFLNVCCLTRVVFSTSKPVLPITNCWMAFQSFSRSLWIGKSRSYSGCTGTTHVCEHALHLYCLFILAEYRLAKPLNFTRWDDLHLGQGRFVGSFRFPI